MTTEAQKLAVLDDLISIAQQEKIMAEDERWPNLAKDMETVINWLEKVRKR